MKKNDQKKPGNESDVTLNTFFQMVDEVVEKSNSDLASKKLIDSAVKKWHADSRYAI